MLQTKIFLKYFTISVVLIFIISVVFLSNKTLLFFFPDKIWAHKVNNIEKLEEASKKYAGIELDVVFHKKTNSFDVNHPTDSSINLSLTEFFLSQKNSVSNCKYWIDFKNLDYENKKLSADKLDSIANVFEIDKKNIIIESISPKFLKLFDDKGFLTSYYLPTNLNLLDDKNLESVLKTINTNISTFKNTYISFNYKDYEIINRRFPYKKKLTWFTNYGSLNKISARILLFEISMDENVDILLIPLK